jgi:hypothetical protein
VETVDVLPGIEPLHGRPLVQVAGERQLHEDAVDVRQATHPVELGLQVELAYILWQGNNVHVHADLLASLLFASDVQEAVRPVGG